MRAFGDMGKYEILILSHRGGHVQLDYIFARKG